MDDTGSPNGLRCRIMPPRRIALAMIGVLAWGSAFAQDLPPDRLAPEETQSAEPIGAGADQPLADVRVAGNQTIPSQAILAHIKSRAGRPVSGQTITEDVQALHRTRWFITVSPRVISEGPNGPELVFEVVERPIVQRVEYRGNEEIKEKHLAALSGLRRGSPYNPQTNIEVARRLEAHYKEKGFTFAEVKLVSGDQPDQREVVFEIVEGPKVRVEDIVFRGNSGFTIASGLADANLRLHLQTERMLPLIPGMLAVPIGGLYKPETIANDIASLKSYYHGLGYVDVEITHQKHFSEDRSRVVIEYLIKEGPAYEVEKIEIQGNDIYSREELLAEGNLRPGERFNERKLNKDLTHMRDLYGSLGRLYSSVDPVLQYSETPGKLSLVYQINEDRPVYVRNVNVDLRGDNPYTRETLIRNLSQIHPGDLADPKLIRRTKSRIEGSGMFESGGTDGVEIDIQRVGFDELESDDALEEDPVFRGQTPDASFGGGQFAAPRDPRMGTSQSVRKTTAYLPPVEQQVVAANGPASRAMAPTVSAPAGSGAASIAGSSPFGAPANAPGSGVVTADAIVNPFSQPPVIQPISGQLNEYSPSYAPMSPQGDPMGNYIQNGQLPPRYIDLNMTATEARTGRLMIGAGVNSNSGVVGNIVFSEDNFDLFNVPRGPQDIWNGTAFRGDGQKFRVEAAPGDVVSRYLVSWTDPFFLDTDFSLSTSGFFFQRYYPDWNEERAGGRFSLGRQLTQNLSVSGIVRAEHVELWDPTYPTPRILQEAVGNSTLVTGGGAITWDNRDSPLLPSEGQMVEFTYTQGITDYQYPRFDLEGNQYYTLFSRPDGTGKHILSLGGQLGWTGDETPIFERYYAGGFQSLRGFEFRGVGPREYGVNIGGQFLLAGSVQYMFPLLANDALHGVVFSDFGTVNEDVSIDNFRASIGTGLRIAIPAFGPAPLAFDFAFPLAKVDGDETQIFSFYIGMQR